MHPTIEQVKEIVDAYKSGLSQSQIGRLHGLTQPAVSEILRRNGVNGRTSGHRPPIDGAESSAIIAAYNSGASQCEVSRRFSRSQGVISKLLRRNGVKCRPCWRRKAHFFDETFFDVIDTEEKAYWLGFIAADGSICRTNRCRWLSVELQLSDEPHLRKLIASLASVKEPTQRTNNNGRGCSLVRFHSTALVDALIRLGVHERKTYDLVPWDGPKDLMRHYWRGFIDGDGCLYQRSRHCALAVSGTRQMIQGFADFVAAIRGTDNVKIRRLSHTRAAFGIAYSGNKGVEVIVRALYGGATIYLDRKMLLAQRMMEMIAMG